MALDLRQLDAFRTVAVAGSLGRAAARLNVTQPALSRTIKRLEDEIGAPLFERHSKGMQMTDVGTLLLPRASLILRESEQAVEEVDAMRGLAKGAIRVGAVGSIACSILPDAIERVLVKWPNLQVQVLEGLWDQLSDALATREIDLALSVAVPDTEEIIAIKECRWTDRSFVVAGRRHPLRGREKLQPADVLQEPWAITPKGTGPYTQMSDMFAAHGLGLPNVLVETRSLLLIKRLVTNSGFLSWMAEPMYEVEKKAKLIDALRIRGATSTRTLTAFRRRSGLLPRPAVKLLEELRFLTSPGKTKDRDHEGQTGT